jgi:hypothetical protein
MAYKQNPGRVNNPKTGNGVPAPFKQTMGATGMGTKAGEKVNPKSVSPMKQMETVNKVVSKAKEFGGKIVKGIKKMDKALEGKSDTRSFNTKDTAFGRRSTGARAGEKVSPVKMKVSKKTAYDIKEASNQKLKPSARKNYAENAQAAMKNKKTPAKMKKC